MEPAATRQLIKVWATSDKTADKPGRGPVRMLFSLELTHMNSCRNQGFAVPEEVEISAAAV
jgi:hypothetical protein